MGKLVILGIGFIGGIFWLDDMRGDCGGDGCDGGLMGKFWSWCVDGSTLAFGGADRPDPQKKGGFMFFLGLLKN